MPICWQLNSAISAFFLRRCAAKKKKVPRGDLCAWEERDDAPSLVDFPNQWNPRNGPSQPVARFVARSTEDLVRWRSEWMAGNRVISQTPNGFFLGKKWVSSEETLLNAMKYLKNRYFQYVFWLIDQNFAVPLCVRIILGDVAMHRCSYEYHIDHVCHGAQVCKLTGTTSSKLVVLMHLGGTGH